MLPNSEFDISSTYYNCDEFIKAKFDSDKNFSILHLNIHSIQLHVNELRILLQTLDYKFDVIAISESKLRTDPLIDISLDGYQPPYCTYTDATKGGTILYVSSALTYKPRKDLEIYESKELETSFIEIINKKMSNDIIGVVYRHPNMDTKNFIEDKLDELLNKLDKESNKNIFIAGDFNFDLLKFSVHNDTNNFFNKMSSNLLAPLILIPTKINTKNDTLIDNIFSNQVPSDTISGNLSVNFSDGHLPSFVITPKIKHSPPKRHNIYTRDMKNFDQESFLLNVAQIDWDSLIDENDANKSFDQFLGKINNILDSHAPMKKMTRKDIKQKYKPWITNGILKSIKRKDKLYHRYIKGKGDARLKIHTEYKTLKNKLNVIIKISKKIHYENFFAIHANNITKVWTGIKELINLKTKNVYSPNCIEDRNKMITSNIDICNSFNNYFSSIADNILQDCKTPVIKTYDKFMPEQNPNSFVFELCDPIEVFLLINDLNPKKATGPNGIPTNILQMLGRPMSIHLSKIFNIMICTGVHPDKLKLAHVIPIFKKGSRLLVSNYRPISLLSNLNMIFEKIVYKRIYAFLDKYHLLYDLQFGFRAKHSTDQALIHMTEKIRSALDSGKVSCGIFVDLQKAFDTVNHEILLKKLHHYGFRG